MDKRYLIFWIAGLFIFTISCQQKHTKKQQAELDVHLQGKINKHSQIPFDSSALAVFFRSYPELENYENQVTGIYRKYNFNHLWFDENGVVEFGNSLYSKFRELDKEGVVSVFPYHAKLAGVFEDEIENTLPKVETEVMLTAAFLFYVDKVYSGMDEKTTAALEWLLPRKQLSYENVLDSVLLNQTLLDKNHQVLLPQYYKLRNFLMTYRQIEKQGGWNTIEYNPKMKPVKPGDTSQVIVQIRERLFITGHLPINNQSNKYDIELESAIKEFQLHHGHTVRKEIIPALIAEMNVPVSERIRKIMINMERCRWVSPEVVKSDELIVVNIPSYMLSYFRDGKNIFQSPVVVGKNTSKTVIFSGNMSYVVFSPYWNVPESILKNEIKPGIAKDPNYLAKHNMEWHNGQVRQKPGKNNSLGLVKFLFPNSNNIYLHDTPSKSLFGRADRAFSHGCIRVGKPRDLAIEILKNYPEWTPGKIDAAMNSGTEKWVTLSKKIPVYIGYFTAWVNEAGDINFYDDVYKLDDRLYKLLIEN